MVADVSMQRYSCRLLSRLTDKSKERVDEFLIEKYIEISIGVSINTGIVYAAPDPHSFSVTI